VARYLSQEWFDEINGVTATQAGIAGDARFVLQQIVTGGPDGEVRYWVRVDGGVVEARLGEAEEPDVTVNQSYETAMAVSSGQMTAQAAFVAGRIRVSGNTTLLLDHQAALAALADALAPVRRHTSYR
jgi:putative sterol carrier protein